MLVYWTIDCSDNEPQRECSDVNEPQKESSNIDYRHSKNAPALNHRWECSDIEPQQEWSDIDHEPL
jgi:hypothetical protein